MSGWVAIAANLLLLLDAFVAGSMFFTLLPVSIAILCLPANAIGFMRWKNDITMLQYVLSIHLLVGATSIMVAFLIAQFGRRPFQYLLDWN